MNAPWSAAIYDQIVGRAIRYRSHAHLPENERFVEVYTIKLTPPEAYMNARRNVFDNMDTYQKCSHVLNSGTVITGDQCLYNIIISKKRAEMRNVMDMLIRASINATPAERQAAERRAAAERQGRTSRQREQPAGRNNIFMRFQDIANEDRARNVANRERTRRERVGDNRTPTTDNRSAENGECQTNRLTRYPACDGKEDPITFETIRRGAGVCLNKRCYDVSTFDANNAVVNDPFTRERLTDEDVRNIERTRRRVRS